MEDILVILNLKIDDFQLWFLCKSDLQIYPAEKKKEINKKKFQIEKRQNIYSSFWFESRTIMNRTWYFKGLECGIMGGGVVNLACKRIFPDKSFLSVLFLYILNLDVCLYVYMFTPDMRGVNMADKNYFRTYNGVIENSRIYITSSSIESA